jgi:hypothetical protein
MKTEESGLKGGGSPYNNWIEPTAGGQHVFRLRESRAGDPPGLYLPVQALRPSSRLIQALYGRNKVKVRHQENFK